MLCKVSEQFPILNFDCKTFLQQQNKRTMSQGFVRQVLIYSIPCTSNNCLAVIQSPGPVQLLIVLVLSPPPIIILLGPNWIGICEKLQLLLLLASLRLCSVGEFISRRGRINFSYWRSPASQAASEQPADLHLNEGLGLGLPSSSSHINITSL